MKKKFLYGLAVLAIAGVAAFNMSVNSNKYGLSDISLANVAALAQSENTAECFLYCTVSLYYDCIVENNYSGSWGEYLTCTWQRNI